MAVTTPKAQLNPLNRADGSATYSHGGYSILGSVNGPIEVTRRDELPEEAAVEVIVRPSVGVGSPKERHLESILHALLRSTILVRALPRSLIQVVLQVVSLPDDSDESIAPSISTSSLPLLPHLIQTALLALLSSALPLRTTFTSALIALSPSNTPIPSPSPKEIRAATSLHVFAFSTSGACLISESTGRFSLAHYSAAYKVAERICCEQKGDTDAAMDVEKQSLDLTDFVRAKVTEKVEREQRWRTDA